MCETCEGLGYIEDINLNELLDWDKSLNEGAINFPSFGPDKERGKLIVIVVYLIMIKIKSIYKEELDLFLYQEPIKLKPARRMAKISKVFGTYT